MLLVFSLAGRTRTAIVRHAIMNGCNRAKHIMSPDIGIDAFFSFRQKV